MPSLPYRGPTPPVTAKDITYPSYVDTLLAQNIPQSTVDSLLTAGFAPYVTKTYVDTQDQLNATKAFIDAGDATRLKLAQKEIINGIAGLGPSGRVNVSRVNVASTQRFPKPFTSPAAYHSSPVSATGAEVQLFPCPVADPGFTYKLLVTGLIDATTSVDGEFPVVRVRQGSTTGQLVATGAGCSETYTGGTLTEFSTVGGQGYTIPSWAVTLDVICLGGGGGGAGGSSFGTDGKGGAAGVAWGITLTRGVDIPIGTNTITFTVGEGGTAGADDNGNGGDGSPTTAVAAGWAGVTGAGGAGGEGTKAFLSNEDFGQGPGTLPYNGHNYAGGADQEELGQPGNPPGGGGAGGNGLFGSSEPGGAGASGAAWVMAYPSPNVPYGPVTIVPRAYNAQTPITGATTLYVMLARTGATSTATASPLRPNLWVVPIPA